MSTSFTSSTSDDHIKLSSTNAWVVLEALGLEGTDEHGELFGEAPGPEFHSRVLAAKTADPQEASPDYQISGWLGRSATYMQEVLSDLAELTKDAEWVRWS